MKKQFNKKILLISSLTLLVAIYFIPHIAFAGVVGSFVDTICSLIAYIIYFFGQAIAFVIDKCGGQFDKLLFNYDGNSLQGDLNLMILKSGKVTDKIIMLYKAMQYIATCVFITASLWIIMDFVKTSNDPRHKAVLIRRLKRMIISMFLLTSIPVFIDIMLTINCVIVDMFRLITEEFASNSQTIDYSKTFLTEVFEGLWKEASGAEALVIAICYLMATFINFWLVIFYMIRDLTISFLLIMSPFMCCLLPYRSDLLIAWFKEIAANIFTQSIQALIFAVNIAIIAGIANNSSDFYSNIYALVSFSMFIPMTAQLKKLIGLEGEMGAAKSNAGLGAAIMGVALAGRAVKGIKNTYGNFKDSHERIKDLKAERDNIGSSDFSRPLPNYNSQMGNKVGSEALSVMSRVGKVGMAMASGGYGTSLGGNYNNANTQEFARDRNTIDGEIAAIRKQRFASTISGIASGIGTATFAVAGSGLGQFGAFAAADLGGELGASTGTVAGSAIGNATSASLERIQDIMYGKGIRPELTSISNGNKSWSLGNIKYNANNMLGNISKNKKAMLSDMRYSPINSEFMPHSSEEYDKLISEKQARQDEMTGLTGDPLRNTEYYRNESDNRMYTQSLIRQGQFAKASRFRLSTSSPTVNQEALQNAENSINPNSDSKLNTMLYTDKNSSILFSQDQSTGEREVLATFAGNPNLDNPTMESISFNTIDNQPITDAQRLNFRSKAINMAEQKYGAESITNPNNEFYASAQKLVEQETTNMINSHISKVEGLRKNTGSGSITITGSIDYENVATGGVAPNIQDINVPDINIDVPMTSESSINISQAQDINPADMQINMNNINFDVPPTQNIENTIPNINQNVSIQVPNNITSQSARNVYTNIEKSNIEIATKQMELLQQQVYTDTLKEGLAQLEVRTSNYNGQFN